MNGGEVLRAFVLADLQVPRVQTRPQDVIVDPAQAIWRVDKELPKTLVVGSGHHRFVEYRLPRPIEQRVGEPTAQEAPEQALEMRVRELLLRGEGEEEFDEIEVGERSADRDAGHGFDDVFGLGRQMGAEEDR